MRLVRGKPAIITEGEGGAGRRMWLPREQQQSLGWLAMAAFTSLPEIHHERLAEFIRLLRDGGKLY